MSTTKEQPYLLLACRVQRSVYFRIQEEVKASNITKSEFLRTIINKEMNTKKNQNERS